jgi:hypothetical protein
MPVVQNVCSEDPLGSQWILGYNSAMDISNFIYFLEKRNNVSLKATAEALQQGIILFRTTVRISNYETSCTRETSKHRFNQGKITQIIVTYATGISSHIR